MKNSKKSAILSKSLFVMYTAMMTYLLFFKRMSSYTALPYNEYARLYTNFVPLKTLKLFYNLFVNYNAVSPNLVYAAAANLIGNVIMFMPMGLLMPSIWKAQHKFLVFVLTAAISVVMIEGLQFLSRLGSCDIDDFILNMLGAVSGFWLRYLFKNCI